MHINSKDKMLTAVRDVSKTERGWAKRTLWKRAWPQVRVGAPVLS